MKIKKKQINQMLGVIDNAMTLDRLSEDNIKAIIHNKKVLEQEINKLNSETQIDITDKDVSEYDKAILEAYNKLKKAEAVKFNDNNIPKRSDGIPVPLCSEWDKTMKLLGEKHPEAVKKVEQHKEKIDKIMEQEIEIDIHNIYDFVGLSPMAVMSLSFMVDNYDEI